MYMQRYQQTLPLVDKTSEAGPNEQASEALERWLDDGGASDNEATFNVRGEKPLQFLKPQGG